MHQLLVAAMLVVLDAAGVLQQECRMYVHVTAVPRQGASHVLQGGHLCQQHGEVVEC